MKGLNLLGFPVLFFDGFLKNHFLMYYSFNLGFFNIPADEPVDSIADVIKRLDCRWKDINKLVRQNKLRVESSSKSQKFYDELRSVHDIVKSYEKWIRAEDQHMAEEFVDLSRQLEQSRVRIF